MGDTKKRRHLKTFPGLTASRFQHPHDVAATEALAGIPGLDLHHRVAHAPISDLAREGA